MYPWTTLDLGGAEVVGSRQVHAGAGAERTHERSTGTQR